MKTYAVACAIALVVALVLTPIVRRLAPRTGAVDLPSGRRMNKRVVPRLGGLAVILGFVTPLLGLFVWDNDISEEFRGDAFRASALFLGVAVMGALGTLDDLKGLRAWVKLLVQIAVAVFAWTAGFRLDVVKLPFLGEFQLGAADLPLTVLWIVGIVNAVNLIDGLDGLAAGVAFFACVVNFVGGVLVDKSLVCLFSAALAGALLGFLFFNFNPATIFLGDSGSMSIGYILATISLLGAKGTTTVSLLVPVLALGVPIMDTLLAIARRLIVGRPVFSPDRGHIHHRLVDLGLTHRRAVLILYGATVVFTAAAILVYLGRDWQVGMALVVASLVVVGLVRTVGLFQFRSIRAAQRAGRFSTHGNLFRRAIPGFLARAASARDRAALAEALAAFAKDSRLVLVEWRADGARGPDDWVWEGDSAGSNRGYVSASYALETGNGTAGAIKFGWLSDSGDVSPQSATLLQIVADALERRLCEIEGMPWLPDGDPSADAQEVGRQ